MIRERDVEILLVEDNDMDVELALLALARSHFGNRVQVVRDGEEALQYLHGDGPYSERRLRLPPRLVLLDLKLPKISGIEVLREIKADSRLCSVPVVIMTSSKEQGDLHQCYQLGANSYIQKPMDFTHYREVISQLALYWLTLNQDPPCVPVGSIAVEPLRALPQK